MDEFNELNDLIARMAREAQPIDSTMVVIGFAEGSQLVTSTDPLLWSKIDAACKRGGRVVGVIMLAGDSVGVRPLAHYAGSPAAVSYLETIARQYAEARVAAQANN